MKDFEKRLFDTLVNQYNFYIKEIENEHLKWIAKLKIDNGELAVGVVDKTYKDLEIAVEEGFFIRVIYGSYDGEPLKQGDIYFSPEEKRVVAAWNNETPFIQMIDSIYKKTSRDSEDKNSTITFGLIAINVIVFLISAYFSKSITNIDYSVLYIMGAKFNYAILNYGEYWRLITSGFLHGGIVHIAVNMYSLYYAGNQVSKIYGNKKYLLMYLLSAVGASTLSMVNSQSLSVGASGAIFGLLGAIAAFAFKERSRIGKGYLTNLISIIATNLVIGFMLPNIDNLGHLGGLIVGVLLGFALYKNQTRK